MFDGKHIIRTWYDTEKTLDGYEDRVGAWFAATDAGERRWQTPQIREESAVRKLLIMMEEEGRCHKRNQYHIIRVERHNGISIPPDEIREWSKLKEPDATDPGE